MQIVKIFNQDGEIRFGWILDDSVGLIEGDIFSEYRRLEPKIPLAKVKLQVPVAPDKIICLARNYAAHAEEQNVAIPDIPMIFLKPPSSLLPNRGTIILPPQSSQVEHEAELAVVIGKQGRWIKAEEALEYILGYTIANDVTARDLQHRTEIGDGLKASILSVRLDPGSRPNWTLQIY